MLDAALPRALRAGSSAHGPPALPTRVPVPAASPASWLPRGSSRPTCISRTPRTRPSSCPTTSSTHDSPIPYGPRDPLPHRSPSPSGGCGPEKPAVSLAPRRPNRRLELGARTLIPRTPPAPRATWPGSLRLGDGLRLASTLAAGPLGLVCLSSVPGPALLPPPGCSNSRLLPAVCFFFSPS